MPDALGSKCTYREYSQRGWRQSAAYQQVQVELEAASVALAYKSCAPFTKNQAKNPSLPSQVFLSATCANMQCFFLRSDRMGRY